MTSDPTVYNVLSNYTALPRGVQAKRWDSGGFSGSEIWRLEAAGRRYCLRRWPAEHPAPERLTFIHLVLREAAAQGLDFVPVPLQATAGTTFIEAAGRLWELTPWLPGRADFWAHPTAQRLAAALQTLAQFHQATQDIGSTEVGGVSPAPALVERRDQLARLLAGGIEQLVAAVSRKTVRPQLDSSLREALRLTPRLGERLLPQLKAACREPLRLQPAIRDLWHDHVLFTGERVTGLVDYGALRIDTPLTDIARLVGSLVEDDPPQRSAALAAYSAIRPLSAGDRQLIDLLDHSSVLLGLANWARWLYVERRQFTDLAGVEARILKLTSRLSRLL